MQIQQTNDQKEIKLSDLDNTQLLKLLLNLYDNKKYKEVIKLSEKIKINTSDQYWVYYLNGLSCLNYEIIKEEILMDSVKKITVKI